MISVAFIDSSKEKSILKFQDTTRPFDVIRSFYLDSGSISWEIDFETVPDRFYRRWKFADEYWKFFITLKNGKSVVVRERLYRNNVPDEKNIIDLIFRIFGCIGHYLSESSSHNYYLAPTDEELVVIFEHRG